MVEYRASACGVIRGTSTSRVCCTSASGGVRRDNAYRFLRETSSSHLHCASARSGFHRVSASRLLRGNSFLRCVSTSGGICRARASRNCGICIRWSSTVITREPALSYVAAAPTVCAESVPVVKYNRGGVHQSLSCSRHQLVRASASRLLRGNSCVRCASTRDGVHRTSAFRDRDTCSCGRVCRASACGFLFGVSFICSRRTSANGGVHRASACCVIRDTCTRRDHGTSSSDRECRASASSFLLGASSGHIRRVSASGDNGSHHFKSCAFLPSVAWE